MGVKGSFNAWITFLSLPECEITRNYCHSAAGQVEFQTEPEHKVYSECSSMQGGGTHVYPDGAGGMVVLQGEGREG